MASTSAATDEMKGLSVKDSCTTSKVTELEFHTCVGFGSEHGTTSCCIVESESEVGRVESGKCSGYFKVEMEFESCRGQWSEVSELVMNLEEERAVEIDNIEVFKDLQMHSIAPYFFCTFGYKLGVEGRRSMGELEIGEKFAEGGQAELFHAEVTWKNPKQDEYYIETGNEWVLKVFRKGTSLRYLQSQWPQGYLQFRAEYHELSKERSYSLVRHYCEVKYATLLEDGRFAFLMTKEDGDLRSLIDESMRTNVGRNQGPFEKRREDVKMIMYRIAVGMDWMHNRNIIHRDLKAANVLVSKDRVTRKWLVNVADFECSVGVVGTGFWRAPEVLQACKDRNVSHRPELFTRQADIYSYGMTCYEILTGRYPFDEHPWRDYDLVLDGNRPKVPEYVEVWAQELLEWCWQTKPMDRPSFKDILQVLEDNSARVRWYKDRLEEEAKKYI